MLIRALDAELLSQAEQLSASVAEALGAARMGEFDSEEAAEAYLWEIVALLQQQAAVTARILTTAIDEKRRLEFEKGLG